ncbi:MAG: universal stress protein [Mycobacteriales bacterium]|nr:universal stress protein [Mycobacteriales bacterium]
MYATVVVGTDGSPTAATAVHHALRLSVACGAKLHLVTAFTDFSLSPTPRCCPAGR